MNTPLDRRDAMRAIAAPFVAAAALPLVRAAHAQDAEPPTAPTALPEDALAPYPKFVENRAITGTVRCIGSSAVGLVLNASRPAFRESQPDISLEVRSSGSSSAPQFLASGEADLAPMSRPMRAAEIESIERARNAPLRWVDIAVDAIAISVHRENPIARISLKDLDRTFSRDRRRGGGPAVLWEDLGVRDAAWAKRQIVLFGMGSGTGSHGLVQEVVLQGGAFRTAVNEEPVSSSVIQAIATDRFSIGYCSAYFSMGTGSRRTRALELEALDGSGYCAPIEEHIRSGRYPLSRSLRLYFVADPKRKPEAALQFLRFLLSQDGQEVIGDLGQFTLSPEQARAETEKTNY
ncbi:MAG: PstS family phosphate ABC transporter substrate-binding protein [Planctomycetota bacterium]